jgi:hypothetical protein
MTGRLRYEVDDRGAAFVTLGHEPAGRVGGAARTQLALALTTEDIVEGVAAFREKREAV